MRSRFLASHSWSACEVSIQPRASAFTVMLNRPSSLAKVRVTESTAPRAPADTPSRAWDPSGVTDDRDDAPAPLRRELRRGGVAGVEDAVEVDVHLATPFVRRRLEEQLGLDVARVVDDHVEPAEVSDDAIDHPAHRRIVSDVALVGHPAAALPRDLADERISVCFRVQVVH